MATKNTLAWYHLFSILCVWKSGVVHAGNVALRQPSQLSSVFEGHVARYAVDGYPVGSDSRRCAVSQDHDNPYWIVDLGRTYIIDEVFLIGRSDCCLTRMFGSEIRVGDQVGNDSASDPKCADIPSFSGQLKTAFKCSPGLRGRYVSVHLPGATKELTLCEVIVNRNPTENIALQKPTSQSSTSSGGTSNRAVDGNSEGDYGQSSCTHTVDESSPWWRVDLGSSKPVSEVFIVNRAGIPERLHNFEIRVGDSLDDNGNSNPRCGGIYTMATLFKKSLYCKPRKTGRYVNIRLLPTGTNRPLTLCEVEIYSESKAIIDIDHAGPTVVQGLTIALTCPVFGYPEPFVAWVRDGVVYQNTTTTSVFKKNELNENRNQSKWECIVSNIHGSDFHQFQSFKGVSWHRMCAKHQVLADKRTLTDVMSSPDQASNDTATNESVWFRLEHPVTSQTMQIPESCTPSMRCSTQASGWLLGSHPGIEDGVVPRTACFNWDGNCCRYNTSILVRKCHGFYVYKLQKPSFDVHAGYCAEISNTLSPSVSFQQVIAKDGFHYALENHVLHTEPDLDLFECVAVCLSHQSCRSINYDSSNRLCEMSSATRSDVPSSDWMKRQGNSYYEMMQIIDHN